MIKRLTIILLLLFSQISNSQELVNNWKFENIREVNDTINLKTIVFDDYMLINNDNTFEYKINSIPLHASGEWTLEQNILRFDYDLPFDTTRFYNIELAENRLILNEAGINYSFKKSTSNRITENNFKFMNLIRGLLGIFVLIGIAFLFSKNRKDIDWRLVFKGLFIQIIFAIAIIKVPFIQSAFEWLSSVFVVILNFTRDGSLFLFGGLIDDINSFGYIFAFQVLPTIIFFSALTSVLFYYGILQKIVFFFALLMKKTLNLSGSESLAAVGNIFLGQTESPLLIKPYIKK